MLETACKEQLIIHHVVFAIPQQLDEKKKCEAGPAKLEVDGESARVYLFGGAWRAVGCNQPGSKGCRGLGCESIGVHAPVRGLYSR